MDSVVLDELVFKPDCDQMIKKMHLKAGRPETDRFREMIVVAENLAKPKAFYNVSRGAGSSVEASFSFCWPLTLALLML